MLSLSSIVNIIVNLPSSTTKTEDFSLGMIMSKNTVITTTDRVKSYDSVDAIIAAGFATNSAEVQAATLYFSASPQPSHLLIGVQGDSETPLQAVTACRSANGSWYLCIPVGYAKADYISMAAYIETASPDCVMFCTTSDADVKAGTAGNLCLTLQASKYRRTLTQYSAYANAAASIAGYACGENDGTEAFDLALKSEPGVTVEALTDADTSILDGESCNYYAKYQNTFNLFRKGNMADGTPYDEVLGIDMLTADIQTNVMSVLTSLPKVPLTDDGVSLITTAITTACETALTRQFIAAGVWRGANVSDLKTGDSLPRGYSIQAGKVADLSSDNRANRQAPPVYVCVVLAGSARSFTINVNIAR